MPLKGEAKRIYMRIFMRDKYKNDPIFREKIKELNRKRHEEVKDYRAKAKRNMRSFPEDLRDDIRIEIKDRKIKREVEELEFKYNRLPKEPIVKKVVNRPKTYSSLSKEQRKALWYTARGWDVPTHLPRFK